MSKQNYNAAKKRLGVADDAQAEIQAKGTEVEPVIEKNDSLEFVADFKNRF